MISGKKKKVCPKWGCPNKEGIPSLSVCVSTGPCVCTRPAKTCSKRKMRLPNIFHLCTTRKQRREEGRPPVGLSWA